MNAVDLLGRGRAGLGRADLASSFDDFVRPAGTLARTAEMDFGRSLRLPR